MTLMNPSPGRPDLDEPPPGIFPAGALRRLRSHVAITHAAVVTMEREEILPDRTIVIERGVIRSVDRSADVSTEGMQVIDAAGRFVAPGLADMHVHLNDADDALLFLANGVTCVRNMWGSPGHLAYQARVDRGEIAGPRLMTTGPIVDGVGTPEHPTWPGSEALGDPSRAVELVERQVARGYQQIKAYSLLAPQSLVALGRAARMLDVPLVGHCPDSVSFEQAMDAGMSCFEHLTAVTNGHLRNGAGPDDQLLPPAEQIDRESIRRLAARMAREDVWNCPTLVLWRQLFQPPDEAWSDPLLRYQSEHRRRAWNPENDFRLRPMAPMWQRVAEAGRLHNLLLREIVGIFHEEGAPLLVGTDTPNPHVTQGFSVHQELTNLVEAGLSPYAAISCSTSSAARFMGQAHAWGTIAGGRRADLLILRDDPLRDVRALRQLEGVIVNGFMLDRDGGAALLETRAARALALDGSPSPLTRAVPQGTVTREATLNETYAGAPCGSLWFRHSRLAGDEVMVEEQHERSGSLRQTRLWLTPQLRLLRARSSTTTSLGKETVSLTWSDRGRYQVSVVAPDGLDQRSTAEGAMMPPSPDLALSLMPQLAQGVDRGGAVVTAVGVELDVAAAVQLTVRSHPHDDGGRRVAVLVHRSGDDRELTYALDAAGNLRSIEEAGVRATRRLVLVEDGG